MIGGISSALGLYTMLLDGMVLAKDRDPMPRTMVSAP